MTQRAHRSGYRLHQMHRLPVLAACVLLSGCATMLRGNTQPVQFNSEPPDARVVVAFTPQLWCVTPCALHLPRSHHPVSMEMSAAGREPYTAELIPDEETGGIWMLTAVVDGLLIVPGIVDLSANVFQNWPTAVSVTLPPTGQSPHAVIER